MKKRGQISVEYIILIGVLLLATIPATLYGYQMLTEYQQTITIKEAQDIISTIISEAESLYYLGPPSRSTIEIYIPRDFYAVSIQSNEITIKVRTRKGIEEVTGFSSVNISGNLPTSAGNHKITIETTGEVVNIEK